MTRAIHTFKQNVKESCTCLYVLCCLKNTCKKLISSAFDLKPISMDKQHQTVMKSLSPSKAGEVEKKEFGIVLHGVGGLLRAHEAKSDPLLARDSLPQVSARDGSLLGGRLSKKVELEIVSKEAADLVVALLTLSKECLLHCVGQVEAQARHAWPLPFCSQVAKPILRHQWILRLIIERQT